VENDSTFHLSLPVNDSRTLIEKKKTVRHSIGFGPVFLGSIDQGRQHGKAKKLSVDKKITKIERGI